MSEFRSNRQEILPATHASSAHHWSRAYLPTDEERAWTKVYDAVDREPATAWEVVKQLESDPQIKQDRLALLILAKQTVRRHEVEEDRRQRTAAFIRHAIAAAFTGPFRLIRDAFSSGANLAVEVAVPPSKKAPAGSRALALQREPDFAVPKSRFKNSTPAAASEAAADRSRLAKAA